MRFKTSNRLAVLLVLMAFVVPILVLGQSPTTGAISGSITDSSGAVVPGVTVNLKSVEKGFLQSTQTSAVGRYQFPLLEPGNYVISVAPTGFTPATMRESVAVNAVTTANIALQVGTSSTVVEVSGAAPLLQSDSSEVSTSIDQRAVESLPNPGNDLSFIAQTAPGSVMNTQGGFGNFSSYGISATSNLFTLNGMYDNDPFLNLNNSGATNLLLGNNEIQEATVTSNGYSGQFGGFAGATVNYVTKSGSNQFHGNANYWWNGRVMNANNWFNNNQTPKVPRGFVNANQWATSFGGPIKKDKAFFFVNYEGLRVLIPVSQAVSVPTQAFETATINNLNNLGLSASVPFYNQSFNLWNNAPGSKAATVLAPAVGCGALTDPVSGLGITQPCSASYRSSVSQLTHEYLLSGRFDFNLTNKDKFFIRAQEDIGLQATYTDPINKVFNGQSNQPEYQSQASWTHAFGTRAVNNLVASTTYYSAVFKNPSVSAALAAFPTTLIFTDGVFNNSFQGTALGGIDVDWPQGRNVTQYQFVDDFSYSLSSRHTLKMGENFHRHDISDFGAGVATSGISFNDVASFFNGQQDFFQQRFASKAVQPIAIYGLGWYVQDEWRATPSLKLTFDLRMDHPSDPICQTNCFARLASSFSDINHDVNIPYNQTILINQHRAIPNFTTIQWQPRFGFAWSPRGLKNTVLRGGFGIFGDTFPGEIADNLSLNSPIVNTFAVNGGYLSPAQTPTAAGQNVFSIASQSNAAFLQGFSSGGTYASIKAAAPVFTAPQFQNATNIKSPTYEEWNFEVQQSLGTSTTFSLNYVGNHGYHETVQFNGVNGYNATGTFVSLPAAPPDPRFSLVNQIQTVGVSNYNGLTAAVQHRFNHGLQLQGSFSWSHALDEISNGGFNAFNNGTATSLAFPVNNNNLREFNYGNADYDTRKLANISYVYEIPYTRGPKALAQGWQLSGTVFARSGLPFTVIDGGTASALGSNYGGAVYANWDGVAQPSCGSSAASAVSGQEKSPCLSTADFTAAPNGYGTQRRNQLYGPGYFNTDFTVMKFTNIPHWENGRLGLGLQFFNVLNHPNFDQPVRDVANTAQFGQVIRTVNTPTSILGSFLGGDAAPRLIQLSAKFNF